MIVCSQYVIFNIKLTIKKHMFIGLKSFYKGNGTLF